MSTGSERHPVPEIDRVARAGLSRVVEPGDPAARAVFASMPATEAWARLHEGDPAVREWAGRLAQADPARELERAASIGARFVVPGDDEWPAQLEDLDTAGLLNRRGGAPYGLWVRGEQSLRHALTGAVALVGARACSPYGDQVAGELAAGLADHGVTVVSGGAYGVDAAAHRGALVGEGLTVVFLAGGVDNTYPKGNTALFDRIAADGLLVSELPPGCSPTQVRFLARNRLIAAATRGTVVVEAAARSGSLNTANWASRLHRTVLGVPGPVTSTMSEGVHALLRAGEAILVTDVAEILEAVAPIGEYLLEPRRGSIRDTDGLSEYERRLLDAVPVLRPAGAPQIAVTAGVALTTALRALEQLRARDLVERVDQGWRLSERRRGGREQP